MPGGGRAISSTAVAPRLIFWIGAPVGAALDLLSKSLVFRFCEDRIVLIPHLLAITRAQNYGGVFGLGRGRSLLFLAVTLAALVAILIFRRRYHPDSRFAASAFALIVAGALGNAYDRVMTLPNSYVRDFIDVQLHLPRLQHWPTFNLADAFICIGVFLLLIHSYLMEERQEDNGKPNTPPA